MLCSPFITQSLAAGGDVSTARDRDGRRGRPDGLTAREAGLLPSDLAGHKFQHLSRGPSDRLGSHERSITGSKQKLRINKRSQKRITGGAIQIPQPLRLRGRQTKTRHLDVFALNTLEDIVERWLLVRASSKLPSV